MGAPVLYSLAATFTGKTPASISPLRSFATTMSAPATDMNSNSLGLVLASSDIIHVLLNPEGPLITDTAILSLGDAYKIKTLTASNNVATREILDRFIHSSPL